MEILLLIGMVLGFVGVITYVNKTTQPLKTKVNKLEKLFATKIERNVEIAYSVVYDTPKVPKFKETKTDEERYENVRQAINDIAYKGMFDIQSLRNEFKDEMNKQNIVIDELKTTINRQNEIIQKHEYKIKSLEKSNDMLTTLLSASDKRRIQLEKMKDNNHKVVELNKIN